MSTLFNAVKCNALHCSSSVVLIGIHWYTQHVSQDVIRSVRPLPLRMSYAIILVYIYTVILVWLLLSYITMLSYMVTVYS